MTEAQENEAQEKLTKLETIVSEHQACEIDGVLVDAFTANLLVRVHHAFSETNQAKFLSLPMPRMGAVAWLLVENNK